jgi:photosystem II stability/assembly factor-like uncharacterized protein
MTVEVLVGTVKGAFVLRSEDRKRWAVEGPLFKGWKVTAAARDARGRTFAGTASMVYGAAVQVSDDMQTWRQIEQGPSYPEEAKHKLNQVWTIVPGSGADDRYYLGVDDAGLFSSDDGGETWAPVPGLNEHSTRAAWYPGAGGLCAHRVVRDPGNPKRVWCGISAVGTFRSEDGGETWTPRNSGVQVVIEDKEHKEIGFCVHALVPDPDDANTIYQQNHRGMYRTRDAGDTWQSIQSGLPSTFGFPLAMDRKTKALFSVPLESDEYRMPVDGALRVYRSTDAGDSWEGLGEGLPGSHCHTGVLRHCLDVDALDPAGLYMGTTAGTVHVSADLGESWTTLPVTLPRILCVAVLRSGD